MPVKYVFVTGGVVDVYKRQTIMSAIFELKIISGKKDCMLK